MSRSVWCLQLGLRDEDMHERFMCRCASFLKGDHQIVCQPSKAMPTLARNAAQAIILRPASPNAEERAS